MTAATRRLGDAPPAELLDPAERMSVDELRALQLTRLQWSLRHAYDHVPHYRQKFDAHGVHPDDCRELADIAKFPTTTKADLRETYPFGMFAVPRERIARIHASSGTTGKPTVVGYTVLFNREVLRLGVAICDTPGGERTVVRTEDETLMKRMTQEEFCGRRIEVEADGAFSLTE